jgi:hypothetical protein
MKLFLIFRGWIVYVDNEEYADCCTAGDITWEAGDGYPNYDLSLTLQQVCQLQMFWWPMNLGLVFFTDI